MYALFRYVVDQLVGPIWDNETACSSNNDHHTSSDPSNNKRYSLKGAIEKDRRDDSPGADGGVAVATGSSKSGSASRTRVTNNNDRNAGAEGVYLTCSFTLVVDVSITSSSHYVHLHRCAVI
jgi:hypothetical protein